MLYPELKMPFMALRTQNKESVEDAKEAQLASVEDIELAMVCYLLCLVLSFSCLCVSRLPLPSFIVTRRTRSGEARAPI